MRIVVSGASGNVGTALLQALEGRGHDVHGLVRRVPPAGDVYASATWTAVDLSVEHARPVLRDALEGADAYVHLAWPLQPMRRRDYLYRAGPVMLRRCVGQALESKVRHLVHVSSVAAYRPSRHDSLVDESWPLGGIPSSAYSLHKAAGERILAGMVAQAEDRPTVAVLRPCLIAQYPAAGAMLRCGTPLAFPGAVLRHVPVAPYDPHFGLQLVHAADVADAIARAVEGGAEGAFNLAGEPVVRADDIMAALSARRLPLDSRVTRQVLAAAWMARLSPLDPGWVDMALQAPWVDTSRARQVLGWRPRHDARAVLRELLDGMADGAGTPSPAVRARGLGDGLRSLRSGTTPHRRAS